MDISLKFNLYDCKSDSRTKYYDVEKYIGIKRQLKDRLSDFDTIVFPTR